MATKSKTATKKVATKKAPVKAVKSTKTTKSVKTVKAVKPAVVKQPVVHEHDCGCGCGHHCCCGNRWVVIGIKAAVLVIVFLLGCFTSALIMHGGHKGPMRHIDFDAKGCVVLESVKCPKLLETLATADSNADGCISKDELKAAHEEMHKAQRPSK